jgi:hypothetical protein
MVTRLIRNANSARKIAAKAMRKMQVPAYCHVELGVQAVENRGVEFAWKKVISMMFMPFIFSMLDEEVPVEVGIGIGIPSMEFVGIGIVVDTFISILTLKIQRM